MANIQDLLGPNPVNLQDFLNTTGSQQAPAPPPAGTPTGDGNLVTSGLGSGVYGTLGALGQGAEALSRAVGASGAADSIAQWAQGQRNTAATYARPDLEAAPWYDPKALAYRVMQGLPTLGIGVAGAAAGEAAAVPLGIGVGAARILGGAEALFPSSVGENIQRARDEGQDVGQGTALKALALGIPEAAVQALLPAKGEQWLAKGAVSGTGLAGVGRAALTGAAVQVPAAAAGEALMGMMGDPNRTFAQRSQDILNAALSGGAQGAIFGGVIHSLAKRPAMELAKDPAALNNANAQMLQLPSPDAPGMEKQIAPDRSTPPGPPDLPGNQVPSGAEIIAGGAGPDQLTGPAPPAGLLPAPPPAQIGEQRALPPPPIRLPDETTEAYKARLQPYDNQTVLGHAFANADNISGQGALDLLADRMGWEKDGSTPTPDNIKAQLAQQDADNAAAGQKQAVTAQQTAQIKSVTRGFLPDFLKPHLGDDAAVKGAIFDEAQARDARDQPLGSRLTAIAKAFDVLGDDGKLVDPRAAQEAPPAPTVNIPDTEAAPEQGNPVPARVMLDAIPKQHQDKWKALEALRDQLPANLTEFKTQIDSLQSALAKPKRGEAGSIAKQTSDLRKAIEGQKAVDQARGVETPKLQAAPVDETQGAKKFTAAEERAPTPLEEAATAAAPLSPQDQLKARQSNAVQERGPAPVGGEEQPKTGGANGQGNPAGEAAPGEVAASASPQNATAAGQVAAPPSTFSGLTKALGALKGNLGEMMKAKVSQVFTKKKGMPNQVNEVGTADKNRKFQAALDKLDQQQLKVGLAVKMAKQGSMEGLESIRPDHFSDQAYVEHYDDLPPAGQQLLDKNNQLIHKVLDAVNEVTGKNHARGDNTLASREPTARDHAISGMIDQGATPRQILEDTVRNGTNSVRRSMAARLLQMSKADPSIRFGTQQEAQQDHPSLRNVYGDYHGDFDRIRIFDKADLEHTMLHEFTHAATVRAMENDPVIAAKTQKLFDAAKAQMTEAEREHPAMKSGPEMVAEAMSNPDFANLLDGMKGPKGSIWQGIKDFVKQLFGLPQGAESMLDHVEHLAGEASDMVNNTATPATMDNALGLYTRTGQEIGQKILDRADPRTIGSSTWRKLLYWRQSDAIGRSMSRDAPSINDRIKVQRDRHTLEDSFNGLSVNVASKNNALDPKMRAALDLAKTATATRLDPTRPLDQHTWLTDAQKKALLPEYQKVSNAMRQLKSGNAAGFAAYDADHQKNRAYRLAAEISTGRSVIENESIPIKMDDHAGGFRGDTSGMKSDPRRAAQYFKNGLESLVNQAQRHIADTQVDATRLAQSDPVKSEAMLDGLKNLKSWVATAAATQRADGQEPYFRMGREGNQFVHSELVDGFTEKQVGRLYDMLDAQGFGDVQLNHNVANNSIYMKTNGEAPAERMRQVMLAAEKEGILKTGKTSAGVASALGLAHSGVLPSHIAAFIKSLDNMFPPMEGDPDREEAYTQSQALAKEQMTRMMLDALPESSASKIFAERKGVQGASANMSAMSRNHDLNVSRSLANMFTSKQMGDSTKAMRDDVERTNRDPNATVKMKNNVHSSVNEMLLREAQRQWHVSTNLIDSVRHITHVMELGLSVPYALTMATQVPTLGWSELTKHFGAVRSAAVMMQMMPHAISAMSRTFDGKDALFFNMTADKLGDHKFKNVLLNLDNQGALNNSRTQSVYDGVRHHEGVMKTLHDISGAWTLYAEMFPRLVTGLAAHQLYTERVAEGKAPPMSKDWNDVHSFAAHAVRSSQLDWSADVSPRAFSKQQGIAGQASPLVAQFQNFRAKMLDKLAGEFTDAMGKRGPEYQKQATRFLLAHTAAQVALAGTMGLPAAGMIAGIYDRLADSTTGQDNHDLKASYRDWLSMTFGDTAGEVLAHGVSRLGGVDLSEHLGEDRLLPMTDLMGDKRKMEEAYGDWVENAVGSAPRLAYHMALGARDMTNGDWLEGSTKVLPEMLRNVAEGVQASKYGYTDKAGFKYGTPSTGDLVQKFLGFTPSDEANYDEKKRIVTGQQEREQYATQNIQTHLAKAFNRHDPAGFQAWMASSRMEAAAHPGLMPAAGSFGNYLQEHAKSTAIAGITGRPVGTRPQDWMSQRMIQFGNGGQ